MSGTPFLYGRDFLPEEGTLGKEHEVILLNKLWRRLGSDPNIVGKTVQLDGTPYTVVGVLGPGQPDRLDEWLIVPLAFKPDQLNHDFHWLLALGRMKQGITIHQAQADMDTVTANIAQANPKSNKGWGAFVEPLHNDFLPKGEIQMLWILLGAVGFVLLIACVNVANLQLARGTTRQKELAVRAALGASRKTIFAQFLTENLALAFIGGGLGVALGWALLRGIVAIMPPGTLPTEADLRLNLPVLLFTLAVSTISGLLFGCAPAWSATRVDPAEVLKEGGRSGTGAGRHRIRRILVVGEFALALSLLTERTRHPQLLESHQGRSRHKHYEYSNLLAARAGLAPERSSANCRLLPADGCQHQASGVIDAAVSTGLPLEGTNIGMQFTITGQPEFADPSQRPGAGFDMITPDYFKTYSIPVLRGRAFTDQDTAATMRVAMVNKKFADKFFAGKDPLQQRVNVEELIPGVAKLGPYISWQVVGVFNNVRAGGFRDDFPVIVVPFAQTPWPGANIGVHTAGDPATVFRSISAAVHSVDPQIALAEPRTLEEIKSRNLGADRFIMTLLGTFAFIALLLAVVGIYGVISFTVAQREHEIGLRIALGASRANVMSLVLKEALILAVIGLGIGLVGAYFIGRGLHSAVYGVGSIDYAAIAVVSLVLLSASLIASWIPARRAAGVEPMKALRAD